VHVFRLHRCRPDGDRRDNHCLNTANALIGVDPRNWVADKAYIGNGMNTPIKKPTNRDLLDWEKEVNKISSTHRHVLCNHLNRIASRFYATA
jgi:hypothetical protein